jgi:sugar diacid utilization regulator
MAFPNAGGTAPAAVIPSLLGLFTLSTSMFDSDDGARILDMAMAAVAWVGPFRAELGMVRDDGRPPTRPLGPRAGDRALLDRVAALGGEDGELRLDGRPWVHAYQLRSLGGQYGYIVASADVEPSDDALFLLTILIQQAGAALARASLHQRERASAEELHKLNEHLAATVADLAQRTRIHEVLTQASLSVQGDEGIATVVHELTGLPVIVEDRFGNVRTTAGMGGATPSPRSDTNRRRQLLSQARRSGRPVRDGDRLVALAQARGDVLGTIALVDPDGSARPGQILALELGAMVLSVSLAHVRSLAEMEVRLRRDLVDDLLAGTDDASAITRAEAQGHDLRQPHHVVVVRWSGVSTENLARAVERAAARLEMGALVTRRADLVVLVAPQSDLWGQRRRGWEGLHELLQRELSSSSGAIGVGSATAPSGFPRSLEEAVQALAVRAGSPNPYGLTTFDQLGIYRILATAENRREVGLYVREWLGSLIDYDAAHGTQLVQTLAHYCESGRSYELTAASLRIHRSTLRYRLQRIRDVGGKDINDIEARFNLQVATRAWRLLGTPI